MKSLSAANELRLERVIQHLDKIVLCGNSALKEFPSGHYSLLEFSYINFLGRFTFNFDSINILLRHYKERPNIETSIGLIIRSSLLDFMIVTYLATYHADNNSKEGEDNFDKQFDGFMADHIHNTIKYLKVSRNTGLISESIYKQAIENSWHTYHFLFTDTLIDYENPESKLISKEFKSPKHLFMRIHSHPLTKRFSKVYDFYTYYGKYEHFGIMTHYMQRQGINKDFNTMIGSLKYMVIGLQTTLTLLSAYTGKLTEERKLLIQLQNEFQLL
ncbi:MAG: hypothetical protein IPP56_16795 [Bacteroidetes bacterium]|nr:hypothetical protein [Bacteroidota bacterium]